MDYSYLKLLFVFIYYVFAAPQNPEINDQFHDKNDSDTTVLIESINTVTDLPKKFEENAIQTTTKIITTKEYITPKNTITDVTLRSKPNVPEIHTNVIRRIYTIVSAPIKTFMSSAKVNFVLKNIGTCMVNGAFEIISYYLPAALIPLVASAAGMVIPFEPVVMLRDKMPVTTYRRALKTAVNTFMGSFDKFKIADEFDDDPYMAVRFKRRMMNVDPEEEKKSTTN